ncbi:MAG: hypothetical protein COB36_02020 [Alphaproteobacteria bacterium]|nr:MAG: hypothetical protein COB36_02020 [Alphaproteobacteria bacterium]
MSNSLSKHGNIRSIWAALDHACAGLTLNDAVKKIVHDHEAQPAIISTLKDIGINRLGNLTKKSNEAMIALSFYAGDGIVAKIIPADYFDKSDPIYNMPPITSTRVETDSREYIVATYPWIDPGGVTKDEIEELREILKNHGMDFSKNDDDPKNVHRMPDQNGTLVGIDSNMYEDARNGNTPSPEIKQAWREYIEELYPIYKSGIIPAQTQDTNFEFVSIHNENPVFTGFDANLEDPVIKVPEPKPAKKSFWSFLSGSDSEDAPAPA